MTPNKESKPKPSALPGPVTLKVITSPLIAMRMSETAKRYCKGDVGLMLHRSLQVYETLCSHADVEGHVSFLKPNQSKPVILKLFTK